MNGFNKLSYQIFQIRYTQYSKFIIPNIPKPLYQISQIRYIQYSKYEDNKTE